MKRLVLVPALLLAALAACSDDGGDAEEPIDTAAEESTPAQEPNEPVELDLAEADGACPFIDSAVLNATTGEEFRFASGGPGEVAEDEEPPPQLTCAVQTGEAAYPDLTLFIIGTEASAEVYEDERNSNAESLDDLGEAGYWIVHTEDTGAGPALEMGWYEDGTIFEMRYTTPADTDAADVEALVGGFTELAAGIAQSYADSGE